MVFAKTWSALFGSKRDVNAVSAMYANKIKNSPRTLAALLDKNIARLSEHLVNERFDEEIPESEGNLTSTLDDADITLNDLDDNDKVGGQIERPTSQVSPRGMIRKCFTFKDLSQMLKASEDYKFYLKMRAKENLATETELELIEALSSFPTSRDGASSTLSFAEGIETLTRKVASTDACSPMMEVYYTQLLHAFTQLRQSMK